MRRSKKSYLSDLTECVKSELELIEEKNITYEGHEYKYRVEKYSVLKDYYSIIVIGGPYKYTATTSCKKVGIQKKLKTLIKLLKQR